MKRYFVLYTISNMNTKFTFAIIRLFFILVALHGGISSTRATDAVKRWSIQSGPNFLELQNRNGTILVTQLGPRDPKPEHELAMPVISGSIGGKKSWLPI